MNIKYLAPFVGATMIMAAGAASAQTTSTGAAGTGTATATNAGATARGDIAGGTMTRATPQHDKKAYRGKRHGARNADQNASNTSARAPTANTSTTYGAGSVYTDRNSTSAAVTSGGQATGTGSQSATSTVDAYGETTKNGTSADIYGNSTAKSSQPRPK